MEASTKQQAQLRTQNNVEEPPKGGSGNETTEAAGEENKKLIERDQISGTPFWVVGNKEEGYMLTMGKWQLTEKLSTKEDIMLYIATNRYELILKMMICIFENKDKMQTYPDTIKKS